MSTAVIENPPTGKPVPSHSNGTDLHLTRQLGQSLRRFCLSGPPSEESDQRLVHFLAGLPGVAGATLFRRDDNGQWRQTGLLECMPEFAPTARQWDEHLLRELQETEVTSEADILRLPGESNGEQFAGVLAPIAHGDNVTGAVCLVGGPRSLGDLLLTAQLTAAELAAANHPPTTGPASDQVASAPTDELLAIAATAAADGDLARGYDELAKKLRSQFDCKTVLLGSANRSGRRCFLQSISGISQFQRHSQLATCAEELLNEAMLREAPDYYDDENPPRMATDAQRRLAKICQARTVVTGSVRNQNEKSIGAWIALRDSIPAETDPSEWAAQTRETADSVSARLRPSLDLLQRSRPDVVERVSRSVFRDSRRRRRIVLSLLGGLFLVLLLPLPYGVKCDCTVQAVTRRHVPAPYTGVLQEVFVEPGDVVRAGQVLARMDDREIAWELAARQAEYERASKQHDVQLVGQNMAAAQVAELEMERLKLQIKLLENRAANLDLRSPIDGVVIRGDPKKKENARLQMGETLFEVGPLEEMVVDVLVPGEDVAYVQPEQKVKIRLDAFPGSPRRGTIRRVSPQAELREQQSVFVAEVELDNSDGSLRPGMMGRSRVQTVLRPLAWNLFHRAWDRLVYLLAW